MPYIKSDDGRREALINGAIAQNAGELNFQLFYFTKHFDWRKRHDWESSVYPAQDNYCEKVRVYVIAFIGRNPNYQRYNDMTGVLVRCYKEIKRRLNINVKSEFLNILDNFDNVINIYEDKKIKENGEV